MRRIIRHATTVVAAVLGIGATRGAASGQAPAATLTSLAPAARAAVEQIADSMRAARLPVEPLYAKVAEGRLKGAPDSAIVTAVRSLARRQLEVRAALGPNLDGGALGAAATALRAGVPTPTLQEIARLAASAHNPNAELTIALITVVDLLGQRVPLEPAVASMESLLSRDAGDDQYTRLRLSVEADIVAGQSPASAVRTRTDAIVKSLPGTPHLPRGGGPGGPEGPR
jgi:hypothetical protein